MIPYGLEQKKRRACVVGIDLQCHHATYIDNTKNMRVAKINTSDLKSKNNKYIKQGRWQQHGFQQQQHEKQR